MKNIKTKNTETGRKSRRNFLKKIWGGFGIIAGLELLVISSGFFAPGKKNFGNAASRFIIAGNVTDFNLNSVFPFRSGKFYLVRLSDGGFMAVSLKCTHLGCSVLWNDEKSEFVCPCHASSFNQYGDVINPPAPRALDTYPVMIEEGKVKVDISRVQRRNQFDKNQIVYA